MVGLSPVTGATGSGDARRAIRGTPQPADIVARMTAARAGRTVAP